MILSFFVKSAGFTWAKPFFLRNAAQAAAETGLRGTIGVRLPPNPTLRHARKERVAVGLQLAAADCARSVLPLNGCTVKCEGTAHAAAEMQAQDCTALAGVNDLCWC